MTKVGNVVAMVHGLPALRHGEYQHDAILFDSKDCAGGDGWSYRSATDPFNSTETVVPAARIIRVFETEQVPSVGNSEQDHPSIGCRECSNFFSEFPRL